MTEHAPAETGETRSMELVIVPDGQGGHRHEWRPAAPKKGKKKQARLSPEKIQANPDSAAQQLKNYIERLERLHEEKQGISDDIRDVKSECKAVGFDVRTIDAIIRLRKMSPELRMEAEALLDCYKTSLGIA